MLSGDRNIFSETSDAYSRMRRIAGACDALSIIVFTKHGSAYAPMKIAENATAYPTQSKSRWWFWKDAAKVAKRLLRPDLVTAPDPFEMGFIGWRISRALKVPLELQVHTDFLSPEYRRHTLRNRIGIWLARFLLPRAKSIRVVSKRISESFTRIGIQSVSPYVLPIFTTPEFLTSPRAKEGVLASFNPLVLMVSRLTKEKDFATALKAFKELHARHEEAGLVIVGDGPLRVTLTEEARTEGVEEKVCFVGWQDNVSKWFSMADLFLLTSRYEGYGQVLIRAALLEIPTVTTEVGIIGEVFENGIDVLSAPVGDVKGLSHGLITLTEDSALRRRLARHAREVAQEHLSEEGEYQALQKRMWERVTDKE